MSKKILMTKDNPDGIKLEDHLIDLMDEIHAESISLIKDTKDPTLNVLIIENNSKIKTYLELSLKAQQRTLRLLENASGKD